MHRTSDAPQGKADDMSMMREAAFSQQVLARIQQHRRRRRRILAIACGIAILALGLALALLPAAPAYLAMASAEDIIGVLLLVATCCIGWLVVDTGGAAVSND